MKNFQQWVMEANNFMGDGCSRCNKPLTFTRTQEDAEYHWACTNPKCKNYEVANEDWTCPGCGAKMVFKPRGAKCLNRKCPLKTWLYDAEIGEPPKEPDTVSDFK